MIFGRVKTVKTKYKMSNVIIIKSGFQKINVPDLLSSTNKKGENLFKSSHVKNVEERQYEYNSHIKAQVIGQTTINQHYDVSLDVDINRNVTDRQCNCPAGLGKNCKHIAAVINFINFETAESKTNVRFQWNSISKVNQECSEGCRLSDLFPRKPYPKHYDPVDLDLDVINFECPLSDMLKAMKKTEPTKIANCIINELIDTVIDTVSVQK